MQRTDASAADFMRLHKIFVFHLGVAVALAWATALYAGYHTPWVRNIYVLLDPLGLNPVESTGAYLFGFPLLMTVAWMASIAGREFLFQFRIVEHQAKEFAAAGAVSFLLFYLSVDRAVLALRFVNG